MHRHHALRCAVQVVTTEDAAFDDATLGIIGDILVQLHGSITHCGSNTSRSNIPFSIGLQCTSTTTIDILRHRTTRQAHQCVAFHVGLVTAAIDITRHRTTPHIHVGCIKRLTLITATKHATGDHCTIIDVKRYGTCYITKVGQRNICSSIKHSSICFVVLFCSTLSPCKYCWLYCSKIREYTCFSGIYRHSRRGLRIDGYLV